MNEGLTISDSSTSIEQLRATFRKYAEVNRRDADKLAVDNYRKLSIDLYMVTAAIAPTREQIAADVKAQGWKIPRKFRDGRLGRGGPAQWLGAALQKRNKRIGKRGRKSKRDHLSDEQFMNQRATLAQMQAFVIARRTNARLYLASGWVPAISDLGGSLKASSGKVDRTRGGATVSRSPGRIVVTMWNRTPGIALMDAKFGLVTRAIERRVDDMWTYIDRKRAESARLLALPLAA
jgi:hypothetical protein